MKKREDYSQDYKWNVTDLYKTDEEFLSSLKEFEKSIENYAKYENHILDSADSLYELLNFDNECSQKLEQLYVYAHLQNDSDTTNTKYQEYFGLAAKVYEKYSIASAYIVPEILKGSKDLVEKYIKENPKLKDYERLLLRIFKYQKYILSEKEEKLIANISSAFSTPDDVFSMLTDADLRFGKIKDEKGKLVELDEKTYGILNKSDNRKVRINAFTRLFNTYGKFHNTYSYLLAALVKNDNNLAKVRGYDSALQQSLYTNDIPVQVYDNLIKNVRKNVEPLSKYWLIKKNALGVDELHLYDTYAPIVKNITRKYSIKEAEKLIMDSLSVLGSTYTKDLSKAFKEHWIDFCPNNGKRNGAYCTAVYNAHPYVLLSYNENLDNVSTLIHELGHAMHYYYAIKNQKYQDYNYSIFVAEVASQVNQILLSKYLINKTSDVEEKKYLIDDLIGDFKATIYRQTMFAEFEKEIHELEAKGTILTHDVMEKLYYDLNKDYFGKNIVVDKFIKYEWERIPHFYSSFYVYQYATAYAAAIKIAMDILNKKPKAVENYLEFLSLGATKDPIESLKVAGVDMINGTVIDEAFVYFKDLVNELNKLYQEVK